MRPNVRRVRPVVVWLGVACAVLLPVPELSAQEFKLRATLPAGHNDLVFAVAFSPDGKTLASGGRDNTIRLWEVVTGKHAATLKGHTTTVTSVAFSPSGKILASASED